MLLGEGDRFNTANIFRSKGIIAYGILVDIQNEDDLLYYLYNERLKHNKQVFPKVSEIPKGKENTITPDIDLLEINEGLPVKIIGYEVKVSKYSKKNNTFSLAEFYKGLGQSLCYLHHGVEHAILVMGFFGATKEKADVYEKTIQNINSTWNFLKTQITFIDTYMQLEIYSQDKAYLINPIQILLLVNPFPVFDKDIKYKNECLLRKKFTYAKNWIREMEKKGK
jgi:hypothetical protein